MNKCTKGGECSVIGATGKGLWCAKCNKKFYFKETTPQCDFCGGRDGCSAYCPENHRDEFYSEVDRQKLFLLKEILKELKGIDSNITALNENINYIADNMER